MRKRPERSLKELYDLKRNVDEPEMSSVIESSSLIQGPLEESDREHKRMNSGKFTDQNRVRFVGDMRVESGTCNVCSAPCSSCMHRIAVAMESNVDCGSSDNTFERKDADSCSFIGIKSRSCDDLQTAASETSNLLSGSSSHDSYSEIAESKATLGKSFTYDTSEDLDMPTEVSTVEADEEDKFLRRGTPIIGHGMSCSYSSADLHRGALDAEHHMSGCRKNYDSRVTGARDANMLGLDNNLDPDKRDTPCSSLSACKFSAKETNMLIQVEASNESLGCVMEASQVNSRKLNTFPRESLCKKSPSLLNMDLSSKSDLTGLSSWKIISPKLNSNSPCRSDPISSHNVDSNDMKANQSSQVQGKSHECLVVNDDSSYQGLLSAGSDHGQKSIMFPDNDASKETQITSNTSFGEVKNEDQCLKSDTSFGRSESNLHKSGTQHQPILHGQASESDSMLYDVKVCDICGDAGREDLLATCSRCIDGAEHTYCMRIMLDKVPEGDWLCEECQLKEEVEIKNLNKDESISGTSNVQYLDKKIQNIVSSVNPEGSPKLDTKPTDPEACGSSKEMQSSRTTSKRHMDQMDVAPANRKKVSETSDEPLRTSSPRIGTVFSRENSFKNLHMAEVKRTSIASSPGNQSTNSSKTFSRSYTLDSRENSFKNLHMAELKRTSIASSPGGQSTNSSRTFSRSLTLDSDSLNVQRELHSPRGSLSKQVSFKKNTEPNVKKLVEGIPQKLVKESTSRSTKKLALVKTINKSASFKSVSSGNHNMESLNKAQSLKSPRAEDPTGFKPMKERNVLERKSSFVLDRPLVSPPIGRKPLPKLDLKIAAHNRNSDNKSELSILGSSKGFDRENNLGYKEVKKQSSFKCKSYGICGENKKAGGEFVNKEAVNANSSATNILYDDAGGVTRSSVSPSADSSHQPNLDDKSKGTSGSSRLAISGVNHVVGHGKLTEASRATRSCKIDRLTISAAKPSADVSSIDGTSKRNKWKDAFKAAMSRNKKSRTVDQSQCRLLSNNVISEGSSRSSLTSSSCQKNLSLEGATCGKEILRSSDTYYIKTDNAADVEQTKHSTESSFVPGVGDLNVNPTNLDELNEKSLTQILPDQPSLLTTTFRSVVVPEHGFIWQGAFEILRIGRVPEIVNGIQAHLSSFASPKAHEVACQFPCKIQLEEVPRVSLWPLQFQETGPKENNIALYFFAKDAESYEKSYQKLLEAALKNDLALKGNIDEVELLIFPSSMLPESSQRWNMLFFLWGVFRVRKWDSSKPHTNLQKLCGSKIITEPLVQESKITTEPLVQESKITTEPLVQESKITTEPLAQEFSSSHACELSTFEKHDLHQCPPEEFSRSNESPGSRIVKFNSTVDSLSVSSTDPDNKICKTQDFPSIKSSLYKATVEPEGSELSDHTSHLYPRSYSFNHKEICPAAKSNETKLENSGSDVEVGKIPHIHANSVQQKLSGLLPGYSVACGFRQDEEREIREKERLVKIEAESEENIIQIDCRSWVQKPNMKRAHPCSATFYGETSKSTKAVMWQEKANFLSLEDDREHKRIKCDDEGLVTSSFGDQSMECRMQSKVQPFLTSYLDEPQRDGVTVNYHNVVPESSKCAERCFFPLDSCPVRSNTMEDFRYFLPSVDKDSPESNTPDLELALGGMKTPSKKEIFPLFFPSFDKGRPDKPSGYMVDDDDISASLSLSLAFPGTESKRTEIPVLKEDQPGINTSLMLFGGFSDT